MNQMLNFEHAQFTQFPTVAQRFVFNSPWRSFITRGCWQRITHPLLDAQGNQDAFQKSLTTALACARQAGIKNPLVVGAIPFDSQHPVDLIIPQRVQAFSYQELQRLARVTSATLQPTLTTIQQHPEQTEFQAMISNAISTMKQGKLDKVVLSRLLHLNMEDSIDLCALLQHMVTQNPGSYHFHHQLADGSALVGASPELLFRKQGKDFWSCPLAGSAKRGTTPQLDKQIAQELLTSAKDRHEHQLVVDKMREQLTGYCKTLTVPDAPHLISTPYLWHLASSIRGRLAESNESALQTASLLHPTPALSGFPHHTACQLIHTLEPFQREWFGGMVGWCDDQGNGEWVVTIRCAKIKAKQITLFAGAGIVAASDPQAEWLETETKLHTMLKALNIPQQEVA